MLSQLFSAVCCKLEISVNANDVKMMGDFLTHLSMKCISLKRRAGIN